MPENFYLFLSSTPLMLPGSYSGEVPCCFSISTATRFVANSFKYNQQDATLYNILLLLSMLYMFQAVSPPIIRSSKTVHTASGICPACCCYH